jgi:hypothetical protein
LHVLANNLPGRPAKLGLRTALSPALLLLLELLLPLPPLPPLLGRPPGLPWMGRGGGGG